jgi:hypothetical protein
MHFQQPPESRFSFWFSLYILCGIIMQLKFKEKTKRTEEKTKDGKVQEELEFPRTHDYRGKRRNCQTGRRIGTGPL